MAVCVSPQYTGMRPRNGSEEYEIKSIGCRGPGFTQHPAGKGMHRIGRLGFLAVLACGCNLAPASPAISDPVADFYRGRNVNLMIGVNVGGSYDRDARLVARYLGWHLPGNPTIVPPNMIGGGCIRATMVRVVTMSIMAFRDTRTRAVVALLF